jgi:hypothetical protein
MAPTRRKRSSNQFQKSLGRLLGLLVFSLGLGGSAQRLPAPFPQCLAFRIVDGLNAGGEL